MVMRSLKTNLDAPANETLMSDLNLNIVSSGNHRLLNTRHYPDAGSHTYTKPDRVRMIKVSLFGGGNNAMQGSKCVAYFWANELPETVNFVVAPAASGTTTFLTAKAPSARVYLTYPDSNITYFPADAYPSGGVYSSLGRESSQGGRMNPYGDLNESGGVIIEEFF